MGRASWRYGHRRALALDQDAPQELAGHRPRQLVDRPRSRPAACTARRARRRRRAARPRSTAPRATTHAFGRSPLRLVGHAGHRRVGHRRVLEQHCSSSAGATWKPLTLISSLLRPVSVDVAVLVDGAEIAGVQPAVGVERDGRGGGVVAVAGEQLRPAHPHLAVDHLRLGARDQAAAAADADRLRLVEARQRPPAGRPRRCRSPADEAAERSPAARSSAAVQRRAAAADAARSARGRRPRRAGGGRARPAAAAPRAPAATRCVLHRAQHHLEVEAREGDDRRAARRARGGARSCRPMLWKNGARPSTRSPSSIGNGSAIWTRLATSAAVGQLDELRQPGRAARRQQDRDVARVGPLARAARRPARRAARRARAPRRRRPARPPRARSRRAGRRR